MSTLTIVVIAIIALLCLNSAVVVYLKRKGRIPNTPVARKPIPAANIVVLLIMVVFIMLGLGASQIAPGGAIARLISDVGYFVYIAGCIIIAILIQIVLGWVARKRVRDRAV